MLEIGQEWILYTTPFRLKEVAAAPTGGEIIPNVVALYAKDNGSGVSTLCYTNDAGTEICLPTAGPIVTGSGVSGRVAFWNGTSSLTSDADLTFVTDTLTATKIVAPTSITDGGLTAGSVVFAGTGGLLSQDNASLFWDNTGKLLGLGESVPASRLTIKGSTNATATIAMRETSADTVTSGITLNKTRGTIGSEAATASGDTLGAIGFGGWTNAEKFNAARLEAQAGSLWSATNAESIILFATTPSGSLTRAERFRIGSAGQWGIGGANYGGANDVYTSGGGAAAPSWSSSISVTHITTSDITATSLTQGSVVFIGPAGILAEDNTKFFWDNTNKQLLLGLNTGSHLGTDAGLLTDEDASSSILGAAAHSATAVHSGALNLLRSRGTHAAQTIVASGDRLARIVGQGYDGAAYRDAAAIDVEVDATPGAGDMPGRFRFLITPDGSITLGEVGRWTNDGRLGIGSTFGALAATTALTIQGSTATTSRADLKRVSADAGAPGIAFLKARGAAIGSEAATQANDALGNILFGGHDGSAYQFSSGLIQAFAGSLWSGTNRETYLTFSNTPSASVTAAERFRIGSAGQWGIGGATFGTAGQYFRSGGASAAPTWATPTILELATFSSANLATQLTDETGSGVAVFGTSPTFTTSIVMADAANIVVNAATGTKIGTATTQKLGFYNSAPVVQQTDGAALTNSVTVGGTTNTIADFTDLVIYTNDAATIRNDIYQLARKLKIVDDALRTYGLLS